MDEKLSWLSVMDGHWSFENDFSCCPIQGIREFKHDVVASFTKQGGIAVIANQLGMVGSILIAARDELNAQGTTTERAQPSVFMVNGQLSFAATGLQSVLDSMASFCQTCVPEEGFNGLTYFSQYGFNVTEYNFIFKAKEEIYKPLFQGLNLNELANRCKHEMPWLGTISKNKDNLNDIHDVLGVGVLRDMLVPAYKQAKHVVERLGHMHQQPVSLPNV